MSQIPIATATIAVLATCIIGYAIYFDHARRASSGYRRTLRRQERRQERVAKDDAEAAERAEREEIVRMVREANTEKTPDDLPGMQAYMEEQLHRGEIAMSTGGDPKAAALPFFKALKVSPDQSSIAQTYEQHLPKDVLSVISQMIAADRSGFSSFGRSQGVNLSDMPSAGPD